MPKQKPAEGPVAYTLSVIGSSWTCLILRDLLQHGARRFQDLQDSLDGIAPTTLSERVRTLEQNGVVERRFYSMSPPRARWRDLDQHCQHHAFGRVRSGGLPRSRRDVTQSGRKFEWPELRQVASPSPR